MTKKLRERFAGLFSRAPLPPVISEQSSLHEIAIHYPSVYDFIERKYGVKVDVEDRVLSLEEFVQKFGLPPAQILFMEVQMSVRAGGVKSVTAREARNMLHGNTRVRVLDVREEWEVNICKIPSSQSLTPQLLDEILTDDTKDTPLLLYCHFGVRSLDAATYLADRGFTNVYVLQGGIEAWAVDVDPTLPRYDHAYC